MSKLLPFEERVQSGLLRKVKDGNLVLYNYTDHCTFERAWDEYTIQSRGIIFDSITEEIVARPFPKFFNLNEHETTFLKNLPNEEFVAFEKMDGSLGIIYNYEGKWRVATRGSFSSDQAIRAEQILEKQITYERLSPEYTYLAEIIYPENKIIVNYGDKEELVLLGIIHTKSGEEIKHLHYQHLTDVGFKFPKTFNLTLEEIIANKAILPKDEEGYVLKYKSGLRVKVKGDEYLKIAKIMSSCSPLSFWEVMENGVVPNGYLIEIPEEIFPEFSHIIANLETHYQTVKNQIYLDYNETLNSIKNPEIRKELGLGFTGSNSAYKKVFFAIYDQKFNKVDEFILNTIRPDGNVLK